MAIRALYLSLQRHHVFTLSAGVIVGQILNLALMPLLTRLYPVESFGSLAVFLSVTTLLGVFGTFRYEIAIPLAEDDKDAGALLTVSLGAALLTGILYVGLFWTPFLGLMPEVMTTGPVWALTAVAIVATGIVQVYGQVVLRHSRLKYTSLRFISEKAGFLGFSIWFGHLGWSTTGLIFAQAIGLFMSASTLWLGGRVQKLNFSRATIWRCFHRYKAVSGYGSAATGFQLGTAQVPVIVLGNIFSLEALGYYNLAQRLVEAPLSFVTSAFGVAYYRRILDAGRSHLRRIYRRAMGWTLLGFGLPALIIAPVASPFMAYVFGWQWSSSGPYLVILFIPTLCRLAYTLQQTMTIVLQQLKVDFGVSFLVFSAQMGGLCVGIFFGMTLFQTVLCAAVLVSIAYIIGLIQIYRLIKN